MTALGGCTTTLATRPMEQAAPNGAIGMRYALPALQYNTTVSSRLKTCAVDGEEIKLGFDVSVEAKPEMVDGEWFAVDYRDLGSWSKTSSFDMETYENQTLKSFNAKADDQSGEIAAGAIKAGFSVARLLGAPSPIPIMEGPVPVTRLACPTVKLVNYETLKDKLEEKTKALNKLTAQLEPWVVPGVLGTLTEDDKAAISKLRTQIIAASEEINDIKKKMDEYAVELSWIETHEFQPRWGAGGNGLDWRSTFPAKDGVTRERQLAWAKKLFGDAVVAADLETIGAQMEYVTLTVRGSTQPDSASLCDQAGVKPGCSVPDTPKWNDFVSATADARPKVVPGIAYRTPARGRLRICRSIEPAPCAAGSVPKSQISDGIALYPQLGRLGILPFENGFGQNNELSATFRPDGSIEKAAYLEKRARGKVLVDVINGGLDQALALDQAIRDRRKAELEEAEGAAEADLDRQIALATKQKTLLDAQRALGQMESADELAKLNAEIAQLTAEKTLRDLRAELEPGPGT
jgi:hypothetical protein